MGLNLLSLAVAEAGYGAWAQYAQAVAKDLTVKQTCSVTKDCKTETPSPSEPLTTVIFVSFSMPDVSLKSLIQDAKSDRATLVLNGLINDSFAETAKKLHELGGVMDINPTLFEEHGIKAVPTFLLLKEDKEMARLQGNVSLGFAISSLQSSVTSQQHRKPS